MSPLTQGLNYRSACDTVLHVHSVCVCTEQLIQMFDVRLMYTDPHRESYETPIVLLYDVYKYTKKR